VSISRSKWSRSPGVNLKVKQITRVALECLTKFAQGSEAGLDGAFADLVEVDSMDAGQLGQCIPVSDPADCH